MALAVPHSNVIDIDNVKDGFPAWTPFALVLGLGLGSSLDSALDLDLALPGMLRRLGLDMGHHH